MFIEEDSGARLCGAWKAETMAEGFSIVREVTVILTAKMKFSK